MTFWLRSLLDRVQEADQLWQDRLLPNADPEPSRCLLLELKIHHIEHVLQEIRLDLKRLEEETS
jgi:hypothetical protein